MTRRGRIFVANSKLKSIRLRSGQVSKLKVGTRAPKSPKASLLHVGGIPLTGHRGLRGGRVADPTLQATPQSARGLMARSKIRVEAGRRSLSVTRILRYGKNSQHSRRLHFEVPPFFGPTPRALCSDTRRLMMILVRSSWVSNLSIGLRS